MSDDSPTATGATNVLLNQRSLTAPYHREAIGIQGDENAGKALGFDANGVLTAIAVSGSLASVKDFGAIGNGVADDTVAIQTAIDAGPCFVPAGTFKITTLELPSNAVVIGCGRPSKLKSTVTGNTAIVRNKTSAAGLTTGVILRDLSIHGTDGSGGTALWLNSFFNSSFTNIDLDLCRNVANTGRGLYMENAFGVCANNLFVGLTISNCDDALTQISTNGTFSVGYSTFVGLAIYQEVNSIRLLKGAGNGGTYNTFSGMLLQGNGGSGVYIDIDGLGNRIDGVVVDQAGAGPILRFASPASGNRISFNGGWDVAKFVNTSAFANTVDSSDHWAHNPCGGLSSLWGFVFNEPNPTADHKSFFRAAANPIGEVEVALGNSSGDHWKMRMQGSATPYLAFLQGAANRLMLNSSGAVVWGHVELNNIGNGFILPSPDGTRYRIQVANGGALSTTPA